MVEKKLVSIIVPVYNVEEYVAECLDSILSQTYKNIEVIVVDDGSTDNSTYICKEYAKKDDRIKFYQQENQGVVLARKHAVEYAKGEYIGFVDADDFIESDMYETLFQNINDCNIITSGFYSRTSEIRIFENISEGKYETESEMKYLIENMLIKKECGSGGISTVMWNKLYQTKLVKKVFEELNPKLYLNEDVEFVWRYLLKCRSVRIIHYCGYHYRARNNSAVASVQKNYLKNLDEFYNTILPVFLQHSQKDTLIEQLEICMSRAIKDAGRYMGFSFGNLMKYTFPLIKEVVGKDIILYGAGQVGKSYKRFIQQTDICNVVLWVDKFTERYTGNDRVFALEDIKHTKYDFIVLAALEPEVAEDMKSELLARGIEEKILWKPPIY